MNKTLPVVLAAAALALCTAPPHANATVEEGRVGIHVWGHGLRVDSVDGYMAGHGTGVRPQLYAFAADQRRNEVTNWKDAIRHTWGLT
ncbi:hypothetical protein ACIQ9Q_25115 [Streptomyces sp. NPDC094438]|uniref:hypothetical protein n=1 Tax=Streptomyces sp. NPDC094438 TaxID=3366061 RepID=UPI00380782B1